MGRIAAREREACVVAALIGQRVGAGPGELAKQRQSRALCVLIGGGRDHERQSLLAAVADLAEMRSHAVSDAAIHGLWAEVTDVLRTLTADPEHL